MCMCVCVYPNIVSSKEFFLMWLNNNNDIIKWNVSTQSYVVIMGPSIITADQWNMTLYLSITPNMNSLCFGVNENFLKHVVDDGK